jgi:hypothetical protein
MTMTLDNQQWSGGDWGRGISQLQITQKHCHTQRHQGDYGGGAFHHCRSLKSIIIPNVIRAIMFGAFSYCSEMPAVTLGNGLEEIGGEAFTYCSSL